MSAGVEMSCGRVRGNDEKEDLLGQIPACPCIHSCDYDVVYNSITVNSGVEYLLKRGLIHARTIT